MRIFARFFTLINDKSYEKGCIWANRSHMDSGSKSNDGAIAYRRTEGEGSLDEAVAYRRTDDEGAGGLGGYVHGGARQQQLRDRAATAARVSESRTADTERRTGWL